jgi:hypothetical protein
MAQISNHDYWVFSISGVVLVLLITALRYFAGGNDTSMGLTLLIFVYGGIVGILAMSPHTSFIKNMLFGSVVGLIIWSFLAPVSSIGNTTVFKNLEFWLFIVLGIAFFERQVWNSIGRMMNRPASSSLGLLGNILILIWFMNSPLWGQLRDWMSSHWYFFTIGLLIWWIVLYFLFSKALAVASGQISGYYGGSGRPSRSIETREVMTSFGGLLRAIWGVDLSYKIIMILALGVAWYLGTR